jgi:hypothetical protein
VDALPAPADSDAPRGGADALPAPADSDAPRGGADAPLRDVARAALGLLLTPLVLPLVHPRGSGLIEREGGGAPAAMGGAASAAPPLALAFDWSSHAPPIAASLSLPNGMPPTGVGGAAVPRSGMMGGAEFQAAGGGGGGAAAAAALAHAPPSHAPFFPPLEFIGGPSAAFRFAGVPGGGNKDGVAIALAVLAGR